MNLPKLYTASEDGWRDCQLYNYIHISITSVQKCEQGCPKMSLFGNKENRKIGLLGIRITVWFPYYVLISFSVYSELIVSRRMLLNVLCSRPILTNDDDDDDDIINTIITSTIYNF